MKEQVNGHATNPHSIVRISVEKLFGQFTYELPSQKDKRDLSNLFILYGDNGSGKTTILHLLFHLLESEDDKGHKTFVSRVRFKRFCVELADGTVIEARRGEGTDRRYTVTIIRGKETLESVDLPVRTEAGDREEQNRKLKKLLKSLEELNLGLHLLPDNRRIQGGIVDDPRLRARAAFIHAHEVLHFMGHGESEEGREGVELKKAVERAVKWIRFQAYKGSNEGQMDANSIYTDIAHKIVGSPAAVVEDVHARMDELVARLRELSGKCSAYARYGLISRLPVDKLVASIEAADSPETCTILFNVISPYVKSIEAQLKALENIHDVVNTFVRNLNKFFAGSKVIQFNLRAGFTIRSSIGDQLELEMLSSGEKQLLLLLCNTLAARDKASILIIDEPEISLNIKWQRRLIKALLDCIKGSNVQLVFATHSIELLAQHKHRVVRLDNLEMPREEKQEASGEPDERRTEDDTRVGSEV